MIELHVFRGAAGEREVEWIVDLYGPADPKYLDARFVRHQFAENPFGWSVHAFALADGRAVGHCALLPVPARSGDETLVSGKFEAFAVRSEHQSSALPDGRLVGLALLSELYDRAAESGFAVLHDLVGPDIGLMHRLHGASRVQVPWQTLVGAGNRQMLASLGGGHVVAASLVAATQRSLVRTARLASPPAVVRSVDPGDAPPPAHVLEPGRWTLEAADMWEWLVATGLLAWLEEPSGGRGLVRVPGVARQAAELLDWRPGRRPLAGALAAVAAMARLGREGRSVRIGNPTGDPDLRRAARMLGLLPARKPLTLYVKSLQPGLDASGVAVTPFFFATF